MAYLRGYHHNITITYPKDNYKVRVMTDHAFGKFARTFTARAIAVATVIPLPLVMLYKKRFRLQSNFHINISISDWFAENQSFLEKHIQAKYLGGRICD